MPTFAGKSAESLMQAGRLQEALPVARDEARAAPADVATQERYIDLLSTIGLWKVAADVYGKRVRSNPGDADSHYLHGRSVPTAEEAAEAYNLALQIDPGHARAYMGLGAVERARGDAHKAAIAYGAALDLDNTLTEAWTGLSLSKLIAGDNEGALKAARDGVAAVPTHADGYLTIAALTEGSATPVLEQAVAAAPADARLHAALSEALLAEGKGKAASTSANKSLALDPGNTDARLSLLFADCMSRDALDAKGYMTMLELRQVEKHSPDEASTKYDDLVRTYGKCELSYMGRARLQARNGDMMRAMADLDKAVAMAPDNVEARAAYGLLLQSLGRFGDALPHLAKASSMRPHDASLAMAMGMATAGTGDLAGSQKLLSRAFRDHPYDSRVALTYAQLLSEGGDRDAAYQTLKAASGRIQDPRLVLALAAAAKDAGRIEEAATLIEELGKATGNDGWIETARRLRESAAGG
jgi:Flp pilus assembly protein TadD